MILAGLAALISAGLIAVLALSKKTSPTVKKVSIVALIFIGVAFITCTILLLLFGSYAVKGKGAVDFPVVPAKEIKQDIATLLIVSAVVIVLLILVIVLSIRERKPKRSP